MKRRMNRPEQPMLKFSPYAWAKLTFMRDMTDNEVGGFGITSAEDLLLIEDIAIVKQKVTPVTVSFQDESVADLFEDQVVMGRKPEQFARHWIHTHPGSCPEPSGTDDETFHRVFGNCDWSVMFILAQSGKSYATLRFTAGPGGNIKIPVCVDYSVEFKGSGFLSWQAEYKENVTEDRVIPAKRKNDDSEISAFGYDPIEDMSLLSPDDLMEHLEHMHPEERQQFMEELAVSSEFWNEEEMGVFYE